MRLLVTGGAGFIGSNYVRRILDGTLSGIESVVVLDKMTYAGNRLNLPDEISGQFQFVEGDICDQELVASLLKKYKVNAVLNFAAESHVDRSITDPGEFMQTNILGVYSLLRASTAYVATKSPTENAHFRFVQISTDEVFGSLGDEGHFNEASSYDPRSPYSASKAAADHIVSAWHHTYGLPVVTTNCSNNYGPYHFPEKLIPLMILNALEGKALPVYGNGQQIRDWLYVDDHARALYLVATKGKIGETYNVGGHNEKANIDVVETICELLEEFVPSSCHSREGGNPEGFKSLITYVTDRPGHDVRYAIDASKIERELGWSPEESFETGIKKTVQWYLDNKQWWSNVLNGSYQLERLESKA